jgi:hypothetical protein
MKFVMGWLFAASAFLSLAGCDSGGGNVVESADRSAIEAYEAAIEADAKAMDQDMQSESTKK